MKTHILTDTEHDAIIEHCKKTGDIRLVEYFSEILYRTDATPSQHQGSLEYFFALHSKNIKKNPKDSQEALTRLRRYLLSNICQPDEVPVILKVIVNSPVIAKWELNLFIDKMHEEQIKI